MTTTHGFPAATILGYPRIGPRRELKKALEAHWAGRLDEDGLLFEARKVQDRTVRRLVQLGLDAADSSIPADFALYDQVLDTTAALGALPARFADLAAEDGSVGTAAYFTLARGDGQRPPLELTKWFDTNYHYLVPEIGPETTFVAAAHQLAGIIRRQKDRGAVLRPVLVGPVTYLLLAKAEAGAPAGFDPLSRIDDAVAAYAGILAELAEAGAAWVQLDEPGLVTDRGGALAAPGGLVERVYRQLASVPVAAGPQANGRPALLVTTGYGTAGDPARPGQALAVLAAAGVEAVHADLVRGTLPSAEALAALGGTRLVAGVVDGRNVWRNHLPASLDALEDLQAQSGAAVSVGTSTSLLHVPHDVAAETALPAHLPAWLAFADQKVREVVALSRGLAGGRPLIAAELRRAEAALRHRAGFDGVTVPAVRTRTGALAEEDFTRGPADRRAGLQQERLGLPVLPTTTIGSFPQTGEVRRARAAVRSGGISQAEYEQFLRAEITRVVRLQEELGLDVLVHGEAERNDMVQYFAENFDGFAATGQGWVQSYGSRCTRPSILWGDVSRPQAFTVPWTSFAQSLTDRPLKGMLTGPVTILAWSFVRDDQPLAETANQVALALRDEIADLEAAGTAIVQVDEPALRELLPLRAADQPAYLDWSVRAFRLATAGAAEQTQIHTHLCYSEFGEVIAAIDGLDADVTSIEAARSRLEVVADLAYFGFSRGIGPGVYDIHSPRVPSEQEIAGLITAALAGIPSRQLWINPDCGLKTRGYAETVDSLRHLVAAASTVRKAVAVSAAGPTA
ncbi:5-methyltetrahydropteroyltriglutamate--homocysteine S-methyltransferase [Arthrobacter sp. I2-34]|uniref:5-methyltetrahydropteroyltriglutamate--homocysteine S-methyltransferase n=1 Tax=Arthrobacter hankyongi TaxID=2904801 RepID=A0ABS9LE40_9MICC|nr:5-methyltetrahydropteroyltriglutamate--homocysteine S-methyltransferase [Arthrobacter hankyongi]MCG2624926.1 5-methyltetrahydropteroyltriglutamate--homocysteine S-methyltransferase [Arthrobacter hankyongi]